jgi:hypothetical protein
MRLQSSFIIGLFLAGILASFALAGRPAGRGNDERRGKDSVTSITAGLTTSSPTTTPVGTITTVTITTTAQSGSLTLCHRTSSAAHPYLKISVPNDAVWTRVKHGDTLPSAGGACPGGFTGVTTQSPANERTRPYGGGRKHH